MLKFTSHLLKSFSAIILLCVLCYFFVDRPVAIFMDQLNSRFVGGSTLDNANLMSILTSLVYLLVTFIMVGYAYERLFKNKNTQFVRCLGLSSLATCIAYFVKTNLQFFFGRMSPRYDNSHALLFTRHDGLYGFHFFSGGSFPSGHMSVFTAALLIPCFFYPKLKWLIYPALFVLAFLMIFCNYHFLSDVIAGTYLGAFIAVTLYRLDRLDGPHNDQAPPAKAKVVPQNLDTK